MSALTAARKTTTKLGLEQSYKLGAVKVYKGGAVMVNTGTGYAHPGADTASCVFVGIAQSDVDNSAGSAGAKSVVCEVPAICSFACASADQTWVGTKVYISDDQTVALAGTTSNDVLVGRVVELVSATEVLVALDVFA